MQHEYFDAADNLTKWGFGGPAVTDTLKSVGVVTVQQLADAPLDITLRLRDEADLNVPDVCYHKKRAQELTWRCRVHYRPYDTEFMKDIVPADGAVAAVVEEVIDDGCLDVRDRTWVEPEDVDVVCRQRWRARRSFGGAYMDGLLYVLGGFEGKDNYANDMWYRDAARPSTVITRFPTDGGDDTIIAAAASEPAAVFQYRVIDVASGTLLRNWSFMPSPFDLYGVNGARRRTRVEVRAVDAAGNRDPALTLGINVFEWAYVPPLPLLIIALAVVAFVLILIIAALLYRRYRKKKAMERYMAKRLARKRAAAKDEEKAEDDGRPKRGLRRGAADDQGSDEVVLDASEFQRAMEKSRAERRALRMGAAADGRSLVEDVGSDGGAAGGKKRKKKRRGDDGWRPTRSVAVSS